MFLMVVLWIYPIVKIVLQNQKNQKQNNQKQNNQNLIKNKINRLDQLNQKKKNLILCMIEPLDPSNHTLYKYLKKNQCIRMYVCVCVWVCVCVYIYILNICIHTDICIYLHTYVYMYTHTHTHTHRSPLTYQTRPSCAGYKPYCLADVASESRSKA